MREPVLRTIGIELYIPYKLPLWPHLRRYLKTKDNVDQLYGTISLSTYRMTFECAYR